MPLRFTLRQLEYFVAVCECGSIALAAQKVNVSSPTISAAIAQLEAEFGMKLFVRRHAQGLSLSQVGERFLIGAREALGKAHALTELANDIAGNVRGNFRVGGLLTFAQIMVPKLRRGFVDMYPEVTFFQYERDQQELFDDLRAARIDVALTYDLDIPSDLSFLPLLDLPPFAILAEGHPLANHKTVSPEELAPHPMVLLDLPLSNDYFLSLFHDLGLRPKVVERTRDMAVMRSLVANDFGYSLANSRPLSDRAPDGGRLRFVPLLGPVRVLRMGLLLSRGAETSRNVAAFIAHVRHQVTEATTFTVQP